MFICNLKQIKHQGKAMSNFISSISKPSSVFFTPRQGKPGPRSSSSSSEESRGLVPQSSQKEGSSCLYYALNTIRQRVGKNPPKSLKKQREVEHIISQQRKLRSKHFPEISHMHDFAQQVGGAGYSTRREAEVLLKNIDQILSSGISPQQRAIPIKALTGFIKQKEYDNFVEYTQSIKLKKQIAINKWFLKQFKIDPDEFLQDVKSSGKHKTPLSTLEQQSLILERLAVETQFAQYALTKSPWHPSLPVESLIQHLRAKGPHVVSGTIGQPYYKDVPHKVEEIQGKSIYGWKPGAETQSLSETHCVTIIGARKKGKDERVYFIDPLDGSDPEKPGQQKIYTISYKNFVKKVANWGGMQFRTSEGEIGREDLNPSGENNYGVYAGYALENSSTSSSSSSSSPSSSPSSSSISSSSSTSSLSDSLSLMSLQT
jgi:hypothetical protein